MNYLEGLLQKSPRVIGISALAARSGKDTLCDLIKRHGKTRCCSIALATALKNDIDPFLREKLGISAFTTDTQEKTLIRDMLVAYGKAKRLLTNGKYWTDLSLSKIIESLQSGYKTILTDVRYDVFPEDEVWFVKNRLKGVLVYIERIDENGNLVLPPNKDEEENAPKLKAQADYIITWPTKPNIDELLPYIPQELLA